MVFEVLTIPNGALLLVGLVTGLISAILGIGGGLLMVPILTYWGAVPIQATATSSLAILVGAGSGTFYNWRTGQLPLISVIALSVPAMLSSVIGVTLATLLPDQGLLLSFATLQVVAIFMIDFKRKLQKPAEDSHPFKDLLLESTDAKRPAGDINSLDSNKNEEILVIDPNELLRSTVETDSTDPELLPSTVPPQSQGLLWIQSGGIGVLAGILAGLFGVGGGIVMVPLQMLFLGQGIKASVRISLGAICLISVSTVTQHALQGNVLWSEGLLLGLGTLGGAQLGARLLIKLPEEVIRQLFTGLLLLMAFSMVYQAWKLQ